MREKKNFNNLETAPGYGAPDREVKHKITKKITQNHKKKS